MALIFADNVQKALVDEPPIKTGANLGYGKYRVFYDTHDFSDEALPDGDDLVIASLTVNSTIWSLYRAWSTTGLTAATGLTLGFVNRRTGTFVPLSIELDLVTTDTLVGWDGVDDTSANALPAVVTEAFAGEATRVGREAEAWLVFRNTSGTDITAGVAKFEVPATVE